MRSTRTVLVLYLNRKSTVTKIARIDVSKEVSSLSVFTTKLSATADIIAIAATLI